MKSTGMAYSRRIRKRVKKSSTAGKNKGEKCQANYLERFFAKHSRSYRDPNYGAWCIKCDKQLRS